jgi:hypothetical protein
MRKSKSRRGVAVLAAYLLAGAFLMQLGACLSMALNTGAVAFDASTLLDENELFLGVFAPCGRPNVQMVDADGVPQGEVLYTGDDMIFDCGYELVGPDD